MKLSKVLFFSFLLALLFSEPFLALALEVNYPQVPGTEAPQDFMAKIRSGQYGPEQALGLFVNYFYHLALSVAGLIAFAAVLIAGFLYLVSTGNPARLADAKDRIVSAFLGLTLLLASFIFIKVLNPQLLVLKLSVLPTTSPVVIPNPVLPGEQASIFWEIPLATITQDVISLVPEAEVPSKELKEKTGILKTKEDELVALLNTCNCQNLSPGCSLVSCQALSCVGTRTELCPNLAAINSKAQEVSNAASFVKVARREVLGAKFDLEKEATRLAVAESMLKSCPYPPMDLQTFLGLKELVKTEVKKPWPEINTEGNLLTFYCQLEDDFVNFFLSQWESRVLELEEEKNTDPDDIPEPPPAGGAVCPNGVCEIGENNSNCPADCPNPPLPDTDNFPFSWPVISPYVSSPFGYSQEYFDCRENHNGVDTYSKTGDVNIYSPAVGEIVATGDLSTSCPRRDCNGYLSPGGAYGRWLAIKHRVDQGGSLLEITSFYGHLREVTVSIGQGVNRGEKVAVMDTTGFSCGAHLHFSLFSNFHTTTINSCGQADYPTGLPLNPIPYLQTGVATGFLTGTPCP
jgi:hypothetical protein